jgi:hypothetical protein
LSFGHFRSFKCRFPRPAVGVLHHFWGAGHGGLGGRRSAGPPGCSALVRPVFKPWSRRSWCARRRSTPSLMPSALSSQGSALSWMQEKQHFLQSPHRSPTRRQRPRRRAGPWSGRASTGQAQAVAVAAPTARWVSRDHGLCRIRVRRWLMGPAPTASSQSRVHLGPSQRASTRPSVGGRAGHRRETPSAAGDSPGSRLGVEPSRGITKRFGEQLGESFGGTEDRGDLPDELATHPGTWAAGGTSGRRAAAPLEADDVTAEVGHVDPTPTEPRRDQYENDGRPLGLAQRLREYPQRPPA